MTTPHAAIVLLDCQPDPNAMALFPCERRDGRLVYHRADAVCEACVPRPAEDREGKW